MYPPPVASFLLVFSDLGSLGKRTSYFLFYEISSRSFLSENV